MEVDIIEVDIIMDKMPPGAHQPEEVTLRRGGTGEIMVILAGDTGMEKGKGSRGRFNAMAEKIASIPGVVSVVEHIRTRDKKPGARYITLTGRGCITDELDGLKFHISAASFYQVNPVQTAVLYLKALEYCGLQGGQEVADAYCGVGTITLYAARHAKEVRGYEVVRGAIEDARANAAFNGIEKCPVLRRGGGKSVAGARIRQLPAGSGGAGPAPGGRRPEVLQAVARSGAHRVVYISCDPATLARDIARLAYLGYVLREAQPVDMFPHTSHVETIIMMTNCGRDKK